MSTISWCKHETFVQMVLDGYVIDGRGGGLVIGPSHDEGGILTSQGCSDSRYKIIAEVEGYEYLMNYDAYQECKSEIDEINKFNEPHNISLLAQVSIHTRILNVCSLPSPKMLWVDDRGQFIVNKYATSKYFKELEEINHKTNNFIEFDNKWIVPAP